MNSDEDKKPPVTPETIEIPKVELNPGEINPLEAESEKFSDEDVKVVFGYDDYGNLVSMGQFDKTCTIRHDKRPLISDVDSPDIDAVNEALQSVAEWLEPMATVCLIFKEAFETIFLWLLKASPELRRDPTPSQVVLLRLIETIISKEDFEELSERCTGSKIRSKMGAISLVNKMYKLLGEAQIKVIETLLKVEQNMGGVLGNMQEFMSRAACSNPVPGRTDEAGQPAPGFDKSGGDGEPHSCPDCGNDHPQFRPPTPQEMGLTAPEARERLRELTRQYSELQAQVEEKMKENQEHFDALAEAVAEEGTKEATEDVDTLEQWAKDFNTDESKLAKMDSKRLLELVEKYKDSEELAQVLDTMGRMAKVARKIQQSVTKKEKNMSADRMVLGDDLQNLMPHEMANMVSEDRGDDFLRRFSEKELDCIDTTGDNPAHRGPIITCKDTSGSMHGAPNVWSSAFYLSVSAMAAKQGRKSVLINFSSPGDLREVEFDNKSGFVDYIEQSLYMFNRGTCFETPLRKALDYIRTSKYDKADILFISDGWSDVGDDLLAEFLQEKKKRQFKVVTILINLNTVGDNVVAKFSDTIHLLSDFQKDEDVLTTAFTL